MQFGLHKFPVHFQAGTCVVVGLLSAPVVGTRMTVESQVTNAVGCCPNCVTGWVPVMVTTLEAGPECGTEVVVGL